MMGAIRNPEIALFRDFDGGCCLVFPVLRDFSPGFGPVLTNGVAKAIPALSLG